MKITEAFFAEHLVFHNLFDHLETTVPNMKTVNEIKLVAEMLEAIAEGPFPHGRGVFSLGRWSTASRSLGSATRS